MFKLNSVFKKHFGKLKSLKKPDINLKKRLKEFREWQKRPHQVKPLSDEEHVCATCHTKYKGNFCPRCGQSAGVARYSFKATMLNFLDVWGLGNRSMFRTIRDLILRPGYMIRDYLSGMQMAYFPPFKMLFVLTAINLIVSYGFNIKGIDYNKANKTIDKTEVVEKKQVSASADDDFSRNEIIITNFFKKADVWREQYPTTYTLIIISLFTLFLYVFLRHSKTIPDLRFSELMIALVYIANMVSIYQIVMKFLCIETIWIDLVVIITYLLALKQFSGFGVLRIIGYIILAGLLFIFSLIILLWLLLCIFTLLPSNL